MDPDQKTDIEIWRQQYTEVCSSYRAIDTFRTGLLGLLPFGSVVGGVLVLVNKKQVPEDYLPWIGVMGAVITAGFGVYEVYGILRCRRLIRIGMERSWRRRLGSTRLQVSS
jgi:hypothetical protein